MQNRDDNHCSYNHKPELKCIENGRLNLADNLHELTGVEILLLSQKSHVGTNYNHEITVSIMQISQQLPQLSCNLLLIKSDSFSSFPKQLDYLSLWSSSQCSIELCQKVSLALFQLCQQSFNTFFFRLPRLYVTSQSVACNRNLVTMWHNNNIYVRNNFGVVVREESPCSQWSARTNLQA